MSVMTNEILGRIIAKAQGSGDGFHFSDKQLLNTVEEVWKEKHTTSGKATPSSYRPLSNLSTYNYKSKVRSSTEVSTSARYKNISRSAAENSVMSIAALVHTVGSMHYMLCENGIGDKSIDKVTKAARI